MNKSIRWLLTELNISSLNPGKINFSNGKLICYHLTSHQNWARYNVKAKAKLEDETYKGEPWYQSPSSIEAKDNLINNLEKDRLIKLIQNGELSFNKKTKFDVEEYVIGDMISDPFTDTSGFSPGGGDYHGKGLYTCYQFNPSIASSYGNICLVFEIDISNFLITFEDLARHVHGNSWTIKDQLIKLYSRGEKSPESIENFKKSLDTISDNALIMPKTIVGSTERTADISLNLIRKFNKIFIPSLYDGIILFGTSDGPVCVSFYPKYDARLIGLGRLNEDRPEVVDWYSSLNDFVQGNASNKLDFATMNAIADKETDYIEKVKMKEEERPPFDMEYLEIINFFNNNDLSKTPEGRKYAVQTLFNYYNDIKASSDNNKLDIFLKSFKNSRYPFDSDVVKHEQFNKLNDEVIEFYKNKNKSIDYSYYNGVLDQYNVNNLKTTDFFLTNAINTMFSDKAFTDQKYLVRSFNYKINDYLEKNDVSQKIKILMEEKLNTFGVDIVMMTNNVEKVLDFYSNADELNKDKAVTKMSKALTQYGSFLWRDATPKNYEVANELLERIIDNLIKTKPADIGRSFNYETGFILYLFNDFPFVDYFSNKIDEFIARSFMNNFEIIKSEPNSSVFINTKEYIERKLGSSHPIVLQVKKLESQDEEQSGNDIEIFIENLSMGQVKNTQIKEKFYQLKNDMPYIAYLSSQSKDWFKNFFDAVMKNITIKNFKVLGKAETSFLLAVIMSHDIALTKEEQFAFTRKFGKSDYKSKNQIANYKHIDPDVFIELLGPDLAKGGMGAGLSFQGFEYNPGIYRLLYKHRKIVDLFCDVARPGLIKMIIQNLNAAITDDPNPPHSWGGSGMLRGGGISYSLESLPYLNVPIEQIRISEAVNVDDIAWFEYFISRAKKAPKRGVASSVATLEMNLNDKKAKLQPETNTQSNVDLDPQLDLSHRKIFGNSLKEVYKI